MLIVVAAFSRLRRGFQRALCTWTANLATWQLNSFVCRRKGANWNAPWNVSSVALSPMFPSRSAILLRLHARVSQIFFSGQIWHPMGFGADVMPCVTFFFLALIVLFLFREKLMKRLNVQPSRGCSNSHVTSQVWSYKFCRLKKYFTVVLNAHFANIPYMVLFIQLKCPFVMMLCFWPHCTIHLYCKQVWHHSCLLTYL